MDESVRDLFIHLETKISGWEVPMPLQAIVIGGAEVLELLMTKNFKRRPEETPTFEQGQLFCLLCLVSTQLAKVP